jgi:hypothetical protein
MDMIRTGALALTLAALPLTGACGRHAPPADATPATGADTARVETVKARTVIGKAVERELVKARAELESGDISLNGHDISINGRHYGRTEDDKRPEAKITPKGDLLVAGKAVAVTPAQRTLLLQYRQQIIGVAESGMAIGAKGADLAGDAIGQAVGAIFGGDTDKMEQRVEAQADKLKEEAKVLCRQLPPMMATQQQLAASLPEFRPYANMTQEDIDDCARDIDRKGAWSH